jgi:uncharacterized repeat protein (TIGR01451 family)
MKFLTQQLGRYKLLLTVILTAFSLSGTSQVAADEIKNTASASGDNLSTPVNSNQTTLTAGQAILQLVKTADRAAAEPGDTVIYRLSLSNTGQAAASNITVTDTLPLGVRYLPQSLQGSITTGNTTTPVSLPPAQTANRTVTFTYPTPLAPQQTLTIAYGAVVTSDAVRGDGRNVAQEARSNIASFQLRIRPGILSDCGTLIGGCLLIKTLTVSKSQESLEYPMLWSTWMTAIASPPTPTDYSL